MENSLLEDPIVKSKNKNQVQVVHLAGEKKGEVEKFNTDVISFGRSSECDVVFPKAMLTVSRVHAKIIRKGDSFVLKNQSPNGCYVNGELRDNANLSSGDVITFSKSGPRIRFIHESSRPTLDGIPNSPDSADDTTGRFTFQYGKTVQKFSRDSVSIGQDESCDLAIDNPYLQKIHSQIYFTNGEYYIRNASRMNLTLLNGHFIRDEMKLNINDIISLNTDGPKFRYLGAGKFIQLSVNDVTYGPKSNDEMRTYIIPMEKKSLFDSFKSALQSKKDKKK